MNRALSRWAECDAAAAMPAELRRQVREPTLSRAALKGLQAMLAELVGEVEPAWERRN